MEILEEAAKRWKEFLDTSKTGYGQGLCYENAGRFVMQKKEFDGEPLFLCHGEVFASGKEIYHGHAWVEWGNGVGMVIDPSNGKPEAMIVVLPTYYQLGKIDPATVKRFTANELVHKVARHPHWGPWE